MYMLSQHIDAKGEMWAVHMRMVTVKCFNTAICLNSHNQN